MNDLSEKFFVAQFGKPSFGVLIRQCFGQAFPDITNKDQVRYLVDYLSDLEAETIVCETDYVDRGYLEDYANYYVSCFAPYRKTCARLHFFRTTFNHDDLLQLLSSQEAGANLRKIPGCKEEVELTSKELKDNYLGFVVVKPIPSTFVGRTCLKPYQGLLDNKRVITRKCRANLFGIALKVKSVVFQEQDKVTAACVTSALWTLFHGLNHINRRRIPSPSEITLAAVSDGIAATNSFPNTGLNKAEIAKALDKFRLKNHAIKIKDMNRADFEVLVKTMVASGHPVLIDGSVFRENSTDEPEYLGEHALTALGYRSNGQEQHFYVHDDRWGPYLRATVSDGSYYLERRAEPAPAGDSERSVHKKDDGFRLTLGRREKLNQHARILDAIVPHTLIIPSYKKVRISPRPVLNTANLLLQVFNEFVTYGEKESEDSPAREVFSCEIALQLSNKLKKNVFESEKLINKKDILLCHMPRFVWKIDILKDDSRCIAVILDATDFQAGRILIGVMLYREPTSQLLAAVLKSPAAMDVASGLRDNTQNFLKQILEEMRREPPRYSQYLKTTFGTERAPGYIKSSEISDRGEIIENPAGREEFFEPSSQGSKVLEQLEADPSLLGLWVISNYGSLLLGVENAGLGHPTVTGALSARIAGEVCFDKQSSTFLLNSKSGRYSKGYSAEEAEIYLKSAQRKFSSLFTNKTFKIEPSNS